MGRVWESRRVKVLAVLIMLVGCTNTNSLDHCVDDEDLMKCEYTDQSCVFDMSTGEESCNASN